MTPSEWDNSPVSRYFVITITGFSLHLNSFTDILFYKSTNNRPSRTLGIFTLTNGLNQIVILILVKVYPSMRIIRTA